MKVLPPLSRARAEASFRNNHRHTGTAQPPQSPVYLLTVTFPIIFTFSPVVMPGKVVLFSSPTPVEINNIRRNIFMNTLSFTDG